MHLCFVAPKAYAVLSRRGDVAHIGGAEVQQSLIARGLLERGYRISFVTLDHGQPDGEELDRITIYRAYRLDAGLPGLRFLHPRATRTWTAMKRANADIYYQRTSDSLTGIVAAFCRRHGRKFVFGVGSDADTLAALPHCPTLRERVPYRYGLRHADRVVAQTLTQQRNLRESFGAESAVIRNASPPLAPSASVNRRRERPFVVWACRFAPEKRLEWLLQVARQCPEIDFDVFGDGPAKGPVAPLKQEAARIPNVRMHGYVPHHELAGLYDGAAAVMCTSREEGFPNIFLEAWSRRIPVVTTFDPDGVIAANRLGICADSVEGLTGAVREICFDPDLRARLAERASEYFAAHHTIEVAVDAYDQLFKQLVK